MASGSSKSVVGRSRKRNALPVGFAALVRRRAPQAIRDDNEYEQTVELIDRIMAQPKLSSGQALYLETLVQLAQAYEATHHAIDTTNLSGTDTLRHLLAENGLSAGDLARILGVHPSMGSKILNGERSLTIAHVRKLAARFQVGVNAFID